MKKSSLKNYIALLEADAAANADARDYWMRQHELECEELLEAKDEIAELKADAAANTSDYWMRQHELKDEELLKAKDEIAELKRRLDDNDGLCALRAKLTGETCQETRARLREDNGRLQEDNERLSAILKGITSTLFSMSQHELKDKDKELLKAKDEIAELRRRLDDNGGLCTLRAKLTGETCKETNDRLREDNERLSRLLRYHRHNHNFERNHDDTQA